MKKYWVRYEICDSYGYHLDCKDEDLYAIDLTDLFEQVYDVKESLETMHRYVRLLEIEEDLDFKEEE